jgi:K+-sensing histidine kinase KdpD
VRSSKDLEKKLESLEKLLEINLYLSATPNLETLLSRIISASKNVLEAYSTSIMLLDEEKGELYFEKVYDSRDKIALKDEKALKKLSLKLGEGIAGYVALHGQPLILNDVQNDPRFSSKGDVSTGIVTKSMIALPLKSKNRTIGVMEVINKIEGEFSEEDLPICQALANVASVSIENARLFFETERSLRRLAKMEASKYQLVNLLFHALKIPVSSIKGYAEYVLENIENVGKETVADFARISHNESTTINKMINDLYVINEYDDLVQKLNYEPLNLAEILQFHLEKRSKLQKEFNFMLSLEPNVESNNYVIEIDYDKIEHCIQHLLDLVTKYSPSAGTIKIGLHELPAEEGKPGFVEVEIEDEGLNIPDDLWEKVHETFQNTEEPSSQTFEAIGLGLFICRKIIEAHGGQIYWQKKEGTGSKIFVKLPRRS